MRLSTATITSKALPAKSVTVSTLPSNPPPGEQYSQLMAEHGIQCSLSRSGNIWDSAAMERPFSTHKTERTAGKIHCTRDAAQTNVFDWERMRSAQLDVHGTGSSSIALISVSFRGAPAGGVQEDSRADLRMGRHAIGCSQRAKVAVLSRRPAPSAIGAACLLS